MNDLYNVLMPVIEHAVDTEAQLIRISTIASHYDFLYITYDGRGGTYEEIKHGVRKEIGDGAAISHEMRCASQCTRTKSAFRVTSVEKEIEKEIEEIEVEYRRIFHVEGRRYSGAQKSGTYWVFYDMKAPYLFEMRKTPKEHVLGLKEEYNEKLRKQKLQSPYWDLIRKLMQEPIIQKVQIRLDGASIGKEKLEDYSRSVTETPQDYISSFDELYTSHALRRN